MSMSLLVTLAIFASALSVVRAQDPPQLQSARSVYQRALQRGENAELARRHYLDRLAAIRAGWPRSQAEEDFKALDDEVRRHPLPENTSAAKLHRLLIGRWRSPRHDYLYSADDTEIMLPKDAKTTSHHWYIEGNHFSDGTESYTVILLDRKNFVFDDGGEFLFYEKRLSP